MIMVLASVARNILKILFIIIYQQVKSVIKLNLVLEIAESFIILRMMH